MSTFKITQEVITRRVVYDQEERVLLETDDWVEAEMAVDTVADPLGAWRNTYERGVAPPRLRGVHPSHDFSDSDCNVCGAPNNGCYKAHAPCGYGFGGRSLMVALERERTRTSSPTEPGDGTDG